MAKSGKHLSQNIIKEQAYMQFIMLKKFDTLSSYGGGKTSEPTKIGLREQNIKGKKGDGYNVITIVGSVQRTTQMCMAEAVVGEIAQVHGKELGKGDGVMMSLDSELDHNGVVVAHAHIPLD